MLRGAPTNAELRRQIDVQLMKIARRRRGSAVLDNSAWMVFWILKGIVMLLIPVAVGVLLWLDEFGTKGIYASVLITVMAVSFLLKDGFSARQWRRKEFHGANQVVMYMGQILFYLSLVVALVWTVVQPVLRLFE